MKNRKPFENLLETETFGDGRRHYFVDLRMAKNNTLYLQITRSDLVTGDDETAKYERAEVRVFEEEIGMLIDVMSMVLGRYNAQQD
jgi:DNA repair protein RadC